MSFPPGYQAIRNHKPSERVRKQLVGEQSLRANSSMYRSMNRYRTDGKFSHRIGSAPVYTVLPDKPFSLPRLVKKAS